mgnify:CR=1 FL=1
MSNQDQTLAALTDQRLPVTLGGKTYTARQATLYDFGQFLSYLKRQGGALDDPSTNLQGLLYLLTELMKPDFVVSPDELARTLPFTGATEVTEALATLGFTVPQAVALSQPPTGDASSQ